MESSPDAGCASAPTVSSSLPPVTVAVVPGDCVPANQKLGSNDESKESRNSVGGPDRVRRRSSVGLRGHGFQEMHEMSTQRPGSASSTTSSRRPLIVPVHVLRSPTGIRYVWNPPSFATSNDIERSSENPAAFAQKS